MTMASVGDATLDAPLVRARSLQTALVFVQWIRTGFGEYNRRPVCPLAQKLIIRQTFQDHVNSVTLAVRIAGGQDPMHA